MEHSQDIRRSIAFHLRKWSFFLVPTVHLVVQQSEYLAKETDLVIGKYYGDMGVDLWSKKQWKDVSTIIVYLFFFLILFVEGIGEMSSFGHDCWRVVEWT